MRIGVVAYELEGSSTGVGRYLEGLLGGLATVDREVEWYLFFKGESFDHPLWTAGEDSRFVPRFDGRPGTRPILWEQLRLPRLLERAGVDFVVSPAYSLPPGLGVPSMLTVHDLSFEKLPEEFTWKERWRRRLLARRSVRRASRVLADTEAIARELSAVYGVEAGKVGVVPLAVDERFGSAGVGGLPAADREVLASLGVAPPYLLYLGSLLPRRRLDLVIGAFAAAAASFPDLRLVLVGANRLRRPGDLERWIATSGVADRIVEVGYVAEEAIVALYRNAELSFYLSSYEGYGLPPLESLASGTPPIVGRGLALDDLWPDYPFRCLRLDLEEVSRMTVAALGDPERRRAVGRAGAEKIGRLTWKRSAELFLAEIDRALES